MKKWFYIVIIIVIAVVAFIAFKYNSYRLEVLRMQKLNNEYESFIEGEISGTSLITLINKTIDLNKKNNVESDNDTNSIRIEVKFLESEDTFRMEQIEKGRI